MHSQPPDPSGRGSVLVGLSLRMETTTIRVREPRELLALLPYQLGFHPQESAVAVSLRAPRGRVGLVARIDLRDLGDVLHGPQVARGLVSHLVSDGARRAVLVLYTDRDPRSWRERAGAGGGTPAHAALVRAAAEQFRDAADPFLGDVAVWLVAKTGYLSLDCTDDECCPPGGRPLRDLESTQVGAHMVLAGSLAQDSRESLVRIQSATASSRRNAARVADRMRARRVGAELSGGERVSKWRADGLAAWRTAMQQSRAGGPPAPPAVLGRIEAALEDVHVRDAVLLALIPGTADLAEKTLVAAADRAGAWAALGACDALSRIVDPAVGVPPDEELAIAATAVLERVVAHAPESNHAPALTLLALLAWWQAEGARAGVLLDKALEVDPDHRLALLLAEALAGGLPPGWVRRDR